jgi:hypothetical protein
MILRLSQKLNTKIQAGKLDTVSLDENRYADWSCHLFNVSRTQYIILSNTASLYSCIMYGKGITNDRIFIDRALGTIREFLDDAGQQFVHRKFIAPSSVSIKFAKALNRSVTSSMNDLIVHAKFRLADGEETAHEVGFWLNDVLLSALATEESPGYCKPVEAFKLLSRINAR